MDDQLSETQLQEIEDYAYNLMSWREIAFLLEIPVMGFYSLFSKQDGPVYTAYQRGKVKRKHELRKSILALADKGSPQAELLSVKFLEEQHLAETDD